MATRDELVASIVERYGRSNRAERGRILSEFVAVTGFHRKHAARLLGSGLRGRRIGPRPARRVYDDAVREALIMLWEASDRICGKRLKPLIPTLVEAMERHGSSSRRCGLGCCRSALQRSTARCVRSELWREDGLDAILRHQQLFAAAYRCAPSPTGGIHRPASLKPIW
jgi:hypothetical protein